MNLVEHLVRIAKVLEQGGRFHLSCGPVLERQRADVGDDIDRRQLPRVDVDVAGERSVPGAEIEAKRS